MYLPSAASFSSSIQSLLERDCKALTFLCSYLQSRYEDLLTERPIDQWLPQSPLAIVKDPTAKGLTHHALRISVELVAPADRALSLDYRSAGIDILQDLHVQ